MSGRNEDFHTSFWVEIGKHGLSVNGTLVDIWASRNPQCGMAGLYMTRLGQIALDVGITAEEAQEALDELEEVDRVHFVDGVILVPERAKKINTKGENMAKSFAKDVALIDPHNPLRRRWLTDYIDWDWLAEHRALFEPLLTPSGALPGSHEQAKSENPSEGSRATATARATDRASEGGSTRSVVGTTPQPQEKERILEAFRHYTNRPSAQWTASRHELVDQALAHSTVDEIVAAIKAWPDSPFHNGTKLGTGAMHDLRHLLKDRETIEELIKYGELSRDSFSERMRAPA